VKFPHRQHTLWLDCSNCHPFPFKEKLGGNKLSMMAILNGDQFGLCNGAVSFPLTECNRCHNTPNDEVRRLGALQGAPVPPEAPASASPAGGVRP
jgi:c(7)-type cytochrome triheme protein